MTTLTRAKIMTRYAAIGIGAALVALIIIRVGLNILFGALEARQHAQQAAIKNVPSVGYGQLPTPQLATSGVSTNTASISLDLVNSSLPQASDSAEVYKVATPELTLSAQDRARARAKSLNFTSVPAQPSPTSFLWQEGGRQLATNLTNQTFNLSSIYDQIDLSQHQTFTRFTQISNLVSSLFTQLFSYSDIQWSSPQVRYVTPASSVFLPQDPTAIDPTSYAQVTFYRQKLNDLPIYSTQGKFGPVTGVVVPALISKNSNSSNLTVNQIVYLNNQYFAIDTKSSQNYPIVTAQTAYDQLQSQIGQYLVSVEPNGTTAAQTFLTGRVLFCTLVYLEPDINNSQYVQPAWMFEGTATTDAGDANWTAYVPAIDTSITSSLLSAKK